MDYHLPTLLKSYDYDYDVVGITGIITQYANVKRIAQVVRNDRPETVIMAGGPLASSVSNLLLNKTEVDICVEGEGERSVLFAVNSNRITKQIIESVPMSVEDLSYYVPSYNLFPMNTYLNNPIAADNVNKWKDGNWIKDRKYRKSINMIGTRGCVHNCLFCYHNFLGQGYRMRLPSSIITEMYLVREYGVEYIHFTDDAFACNKKFIMKFCKMKELSNVGHIKWSCAGRANIVDKEMVQAMKDSGCEGICYGLESGSQKMLNVMNKKVTIRQYGKAIELNKKYFDYEDYTFIVGTPGETDETIEETEKFIKQMDIKPSAVFYMTPYPGTPLFNNLATEGKVFPNDNDWMEKFVLSLGEQGEQMVMNLTDYSDEKVKEWHDRLKEI